MGKLRLEDLHPILQFYLDIPEAAVSIRRAFFEPNVETPSDIKIIYRNGKPRRSVIDLVGPGAVCFGYLDDSGVVYHVTNPDGFESHGVHVENEGDAIAQLERIARESQMVFRLPNAPELYKDGRPLIIPDTMNLNISCRYAEKSLAGRSDLDETLKYQVNVLYTYSDFCKFPVEYAIRLVQATNRNPNSQSVRANSIGGLARSIGWRAFQEHEQIEAKGLEPHKNSNHALKDYIDRETHYALERLKGKDKLHEVTREDYERTFDQVLDAIVNRAVGLFASYGGTDFPVNLNDTNSMLRIDLREHIEKNQAQAA